MYILFLLHVFFRFLISRIFGNRNLPVYNDLVFGGKKRLWNMNLKGYSTELSYIEKI